MSVQFFSSYSAISQAFSSPVIPTKVSNPSLLLLNSSLASTLGFDEEFLRSKECLDLFAGNWVPEFVQPVATVYAGHQFGTFVPRLGDGRAILLGDRALVNGRPVEVQLKGAGPTPYSRGGDGRAALGPVLREYLVSESMHSMGIPTTRALAAVATGDWVYRDDVLPGAVLTRVASSHLRIGTFAYFAAKKDTDSLRKLVNFAIERHYVERASDSNRSLALLYEVQRAQSQLIAQWMSVGFVHGVMNTDNMSISGETLDYGPCAFLDTYDPDRVFSSIDRNGRYAFSKQPQIAMWNLARLAEALFPLLKEEWQCSDADCMRQIADVIEQFPAMFEADFVSIFRRKLALHRSFDEDKILIHDLLDIMAKERLDFTLFFRSLIEGCDERNSTLMSKDSRWNARWKARLREENASLEELKVRLRLSNPAFIPRNHRVEEVIASASKGDLKPLHRFLNVLKNPFEERDSDADWMQPPGEEQWAYRTFCGT